MRAGYRPAFLGEDKMPDWRDEQKNLDEMAMASFGECVTINGFEVQANVLEVSSQSNGFGVPIEGEQTTMYISDFDKRRLRLEKGMLVEYRGTKRGELVDFNLTNTTLWKLDIG